MTAPETGKRPVSFRPAGYCPSVVRDCQGDGSGEGGKRRRRLPDAPPRPRAPARWPAGDEEFRRERLAHLPWRGAPHDGIEQLPPPPPWRDFDGGPLVAPPTALDHASERRLGVQRREASYHRPGETERELVNAALYLRRPRW